MVTVAFISYWGINDPLGVSTVIPHVRILAESKSVNKVFLFSIERSTYEFSSDDDKIEHIPILEKSKPPGLNKLVAIRKLYAKLNIIHRQHKLNFVFCRSAFAGIAGYYLNKKYDVPYSVESYEPHTDYMIQSGEWRRNGIKTSTLRRYEKKIQKTAKFLNPVSYKFGEFLRKNYSIHESRIEVLPCAVDLKKYKFSIDSRNSIRRKLKIEENRVGIYVGKFGGIYYDDESYALFKKMFDSYSNFYLIILSPHDKSIIEDKLAQYNIDIKKTFVAKVSPDEIPDYLSAADVAFALYKSTPTSKYLSPIKLGEYYANGLPIVITEGVGDDVEWIKSSSTGVVYSASTSKLEERLLNELIVNRLDPNQQTKIVDIAASRRSLNIIKEFYAKVLNESALSDNKA